VDPGGYAAAMRQAIVVGSRHRPHPNPRVGAVLMLPDGHILASRGHVAPGEVHAERGLIDSVDDIPDDAVLVVTLEPCAHTGRTPPCVEAVIAAGIRTVVVGAIDPDARVAGRGIARLREAGIEVIVGVEADAVEGADPAYFHHRRTGFPLVTLKQASTLDGQIAAADGTSQWITGREARIDAHRLRAAHDAVMVGAGTLRADDPHLDVRLEGYDGPQPRAVIVAGSRPLPPDLFLWQRDPIVLASEEVVLPNIDVIHAGTGGIVDVRRGFTELAERGILSLLVEGGAGIAAALWDADLIDRGVQYFGAKIAGGTGRGAFDRVFPTLAAAIDVEITSVVDLGGDLRVDWRRSARP
jgi:diaminohydroxyphosphoribosylaminopyrimidine deaminase / 5-amino-6-(5-phosphoribosylamino)uracil reductase